MTRTDCQGNLGSSVITSQLASKLRTIERLCGPVLEGVGCELGHVSSVGRWSANALHSLAIVRTTESSRELKASRPEAARERFGGRQEDEGPSLWNAPCQLSGRLGSA